MRRTLFTASLPQSPIRHCLTAALPHSLLPHCLIAPLPHCPIAYNPVMKRRTLLQSLAALVAIPSFSRLRLEGQAASPVLTDANIAALKAVAEVVLPTAIGASGRDTAVRNFVVWVR